MCGKTPEVANLQDLLIFQLKGISCYGDILLKKGMRPEKRVVSFVENCLFTTLTNVNFDPEVHVKLLQEAQKIKDELRQQTGGTGTENIYMAYRLPETKREMLRTSQNAGIKYDQNLDEDIRSLRQLVIYGLKGISAYGHQARELGYYSDTVDDFYIQGLAAVTDDQLTVEELIQLAMKTGTMALEIMQKLDEANTTVYGNPSPHAVPMTLKAGPLIIVSGHDFHDLEMLLAQSQGTGVNIYTHGEMLPGHGYEGLKKYPHLVGDCGGAWQEQQKQFVKFPGCILMTTNCLMKPRDSYKDRIYSTNVVGWDGVKYIPRKENGEKNFSEIIQQALALGGYDTDRDVRPTEPSDCPEYQQVDELLTGFAHEATLSHAGEIVQAVKDGQIRHFFLIGGCDGARPGRNYFTKFAQLVPEDCVILTLACGNYRFNKLDFGTVAGLPRLLDVGQCNDAYSAVRIATALADAFDTDVNSLPLSMILSWYEQKAVAVLLALLSLGIKNIYLGPILPAFLSPNVVQYLVDTFQLHLISNAEDDIKTCLKQEI